MATLTEGSVIEVGVEAINWGVAVKVGWRFIPAADRFWSCEK